MFPPLITKVFAEGSEVRLLQPTALPSAPENPDFATYITGIIEQIIIVASVLAVLMIVIGGLQYILSFSSGSKEEGKKRITYAIGGLILAISSFLILNTVNGSLTTLNFGLEGIEPVSNKVPHVLRYTDRNGNTSTTRLNSLEECLALVEARREQGDENATPDDCVHESQTSGDLSQSGQEARAECLRQGYIECGFHKEAPGEEWEQTNDAACEGREFISSERTLYCYGKKHPQEQNLYYLMGKKTGTVCFDGPYENEDSCGAVAGNENHRTVLRLDNDSATSCISRDRFTTSYPTAPLCENVADPDTEPTEPSTDGAWDDWQYQSGIALQKGDASESLKSLLSCMRSQIPDRNVGQISSISDSRHRGNLAACNTAQCGGKSCAHSCRSCHYGGGTSQNKSMAVDFGDEWNKVAIMDAARKCGVPSSKIIDEGNHIHISTAECPRN